ncbi:fluoride efflux transporter CrcB [Bradyrhizobium tropiciagri]|uniref:fluoride efflux transporter CrcB n=1 Tax=Bradyrhizobium tropiciagri TaxID=312253 RepID=UPI00067B5679|nr:fluoride efflux transporter CrcB [Bradyrhizobium tropiciagri]
MLRKSNSTTADRWNTGILYVYVASGAVVGGLARFLVSVALQTGTEFPWATLFINATGSFIIGFYATLTGPEGRLFASARQRQFVMTGFCGGYTTFSTFSLETFKLFHSGMKQTALVYIIASTIAWLVSVWLGHTIASRLNRLKGS